MYRLSAIAVAMLLCVACGNGPRPAASGPEAGRIIVLSDSMTDAEATDTLRFGRLGSGEIAFQSLTLHNATQHPLCIVSVDRTCGCTTVEYDNRPIMPDEKRRITLTFDTRGEWGWQFKSVEISLDGIARPVRLYAEAEVE